MIDSEQCYPEIFYIQQSNENNSTQEETFFYNPPGEFTVANLVSGKPYWKKMLLATDLQKPEKKTILVADFRARQWVPEELCSARLAILKLLEHHFSVYLWQDGSFIQLKSKEQLQNFVILSQITPANQIEVAASWAQSKYKDQTALVLDDYYIDILLNDGIIPEARSIKISDLLDDEHQPLSDAELIVGLLMRDSTPLERLNFNFFADDICRFHKQLISKYKNLKMVFSLEALELNLYYPCFFSRLLFEEKPTFKFEHLFKFQKVHFSFASNRDCKSELTLNVYIHQIIHTNSSELDHVSISNHIQEQCKTAQEVLIVNIKNDTTYLRQQLLNLFSCCRNLNISANAE